MSDRHVVKQPATTAAVSGAAILLGLLSAVVTTVLFFVLAFGWAEGWFERLDAQVLTGAYWLRVHDAWLTPLMRLATWSGTVAGLLVLTVLVLTVLLGLRLHHWRSSVILLLVTMATVGVLDTLIKNQFARPRPSLYPSPYQLDSYSFPSGHAMSSAAFYGTLVIIAGRSLVSRSRLLAVAVLCALVTMLIGLSRWYFSVHYATDVLGGFCAGLSWLLVLLVIERTLMWQRGRRLP